MSCNDFEQNKQKAIKELFDSVTILIQNTTIESHKDIDFLISDLNKAREKYAEIIKSSTNIKINRAMEEWSCAEDEDQF